VTVVRHEYVADNPEAQLSPEIIQGLKEFALVAVGVKDADFSKGVAVQVVEMILTAEIPQTWGWFMSLGLGAQTSKTMSGPPASADRQFCRPRLSRNYYRHRAVFYRGVVGWRRAKPCGSWQKLPTKEAIACPNALPVVQGTTLRSDDF